MNKSFLKKVIFLMKGVYGKILPLTFSLAFLFLSIVTLSLVNEFLSYFSIIVFLFLFLPLLLSIQLLCTRIFAFKEDVEYKEVYKQLKVYFSPIFSGSYKVFSAFLITFLALMIFVSIYEYVVLLLDPSLIELALINQEEFVYRLITLPYFDYAYVIIFGLSVFVFMWRILAKITYPYFSYFCGLQKRFLRKFFSYIRHNKIYPYKRRMFIIGYPLIILFLLPYILGSSISYYLLKEMNISIIIGLTISLILCSLYLPIYIKGCHIIVAELKPVGLNFFKEEMQREIDFVDNNPTLSEEEKQLFKEKYKQLQDMLNKDNHSDKRKEEE